MWIWRATAAGLCALNSSVRRGRIFRCRRDVSAETQFSSATPLHNVSAVESIAIEKRCVDDDGSGSGESDISKNRWILHIGDSIFGRNILKDEFDADRLYEFVAFIFRLHTIVWCQLIVYLADGCTLSCSHAPSLCSPLSESEWVFRSWSRHIRKLKTEVKKAEKLKLIPFISSPLMWLTSLTNLPYFSFESFVWRKKTKERKNNSSARSHLTK